MQQPMPFRIRRSQGEQTQLALSEEIQHTLNALIFGSSRLRSQTVRIFEDEFARIVEQRFACGLHSGTVALILALQACEVKPGHEVITVANSDISNTAAISLCGAIPVLCDVLEADYTMDPSRIDSLVTDRTAAIVPIDMHGHPANVRATREIADRYGLKIVQDAALSLGARDHGRPVGAFADATIYSFGGSKILASLGHGGAVTTDDEEVYTRLRLLSSYGQSLNRQSAVHAYQEAVAEGYNVPIDPLQAGLLRIKLKYLSEWTTKRRRIAKLYEEGLVNLPVGLPSFRPESEPTFRSYTIRVADQYRTFQSLVAAGIEAAIFYAPPIHHQPVYQMALSGSDQLPVTERVGREIVSLPVSSELDDCAVAVVVEVLRSIL